MKPITAPYEKAQADARKAGDRSMRLSGRKKWSTNDWRAYEREYARLYPLARAEEQRLQARREPWTLKR